MTASRFFFMTVQVGAEGAAKAEVARVRPDWRAAFSRPGFLTFKLPEGCSLGDRLDLGLVFARSRALSLGRVTGDDPARLPADLWRLVGDRPVRRVHVWPRDPVPPGERDFEPGITAAATAVAQAVCRAAPPQISLASPPNSTACAGEAVLDCVLVEPDAWWIGWHVAGDVPSRWPGGIPPISLPEEAVSRAWMKMEEAIAWSGLPLTAGTTVAEIGCAPGGTSQALLARGLVVLGIDPAEVHPAVLAQPRFHHLRGRARQIPRRALRPARYLVADMSVAPKYTLDVVEDFVTRPDLRIRGLLLMLKFSNWALAEQLPEYLGRIGGWGFREVRARHLAFNRHEVCVAASRVRPAS